MFRSKLAVGLISLCAGSLLLADQGWIAIKARIAEHMIGYAWAGHLRDGRVHRPWGWADTHPIARLEVPRLGVSRLVLSGASGASLAFGPGHVDGTARPNRPGNCVLAGHRDSWFAFLEHLETDDVLVLHTRERRVRYLVTDRVVADRRDNAWLDPMDGRRLTLITCFPFGGLRSGDRRYVVVARPIASLGT